MNGMSTGVIEQPQLQGRSLMRLLTRLLAPVCLFTGTAAVPIAAAQDPFEIEVYPYETAHRGGIRPIKSSSAPSSLSSQAARSGRA